MEQDILRTADLKLTLATKMGQKPEDPESRGTDGEGNGHSMNKDKEGASGWTAHGSKPSQPPPLNCTRGSVNTFVNTFLLSTYVPGTLPAFRNNEPTGETLQPVAMRLVIEKVTCALAGSSMGSAPRLGE